MEVVAVNIADVLVNFEKDYKSFEGETLEDYMNEFCVVWLDGSNEYAIIFGDELLFDGFESETEANKAYDLLNNRAYEIAIVIAEQAKLFVDREHYATENGFTS